MADKYKKLKRQVSTDGGQTWQDMIPYEYIAGELIERDSPDCNNIEWRTVSGYICEENTTEMTQWVADTGYVCVGFDKYNKEKEQVSYNSGISWADTGNTRAGSTLIEQNSEDCGYVPPTPSIRWVADTGYMCVGYDKYNKEKEQQSTDGGEHWTDTGNTRAGSTLIETNSTDCGYIPAIKATLTYQNGDTYNILENGSSMLTDSEVRRDISDTSDVHHYTKITGAVVYNTVDALAGSFEQCTNLASITFPSTALELYGNTFIYCESLGSITLGNNITLDDWGSNIFGHCTSLTNITIPSNIKKLPYGFLSFCENLETVTIEATDFNMFSDNVFFNCTSLESITLKATIPPTFGYQMLYNVPANVNIYVPCASLNAYKAASGWSTYANRIQCEHDYSTDYLTTEALGSGNISLNKHTHSGYESKVPITNIKYSKNGGDWTSYTYGTRIYFVTGDKIRWKGIIKDGNKDWSESYYYSDFYSTADYKVYGNPLSLLNSDNFVNKPDAIYEYAYYGLFHNSSTLKDASNLALPATTLARDCYYQMFQGCTSLTAAPELPATTLAMGCYGFMFWDCTNLTKTPELPATTLAERCYLSMFQGCTNLTKTPELPATTLAEWCYMDMFAYCYSLTTPPVLPVTTLAFGCYLYMFRGCTSLTVAPALPAATLVDNCYYGMFQGCTSLTAAPELPATTLAERCYEKMFFDCTSLTTAPVLPATTLVEYCYYEMFNNCTSLNSVTCCATDISASNCTTNWTYRVSSTGTFVKAPSMSSWETGANGIPTGWTIVDAT